MKFFIDGDQIAVVSDDFENLQESLVVWVPRNSEDGRTIEEKGLKALPFKVFLDIFSVLKGQLVVPIGGAV